jgi:hypothetical protein
MSARTLSDRSSRTIGSPQSDSSHTTGRSDSSHTIDRSSEEEQDTDEDDGMENRESEDEGDVFAQSYREGSK